MVDKPDIIGVNRRFYPAQASVVGKAAASLPPEWRDFGHDHSFDPPPTVVVLVAGEIGDYACYIGHGTPEWVAQHGNKISFIEARCHFPSLKADGYRE